MKLKELFSKLNVLKARIIYIIHKEEPDFSELMKIRRFAYKLRASGFIPLCAFEFRPYGKKIVSNAISVSDFSLVLALDQETVKTARGQGVDFVYIEEALL